MNTNWIKIFHITYDNTGVIFIAHYFVLYFFPSFNAFFNKHLMDRA